MSPRTFPRVSTAISSENSIAPTDILKLYIEHLTPQQIDPQSTLLLTEYFIIPKHGTPYTGLKAFTQLLKTQTHAKKPVISVADIPQHVIFWNLFLTADQVIGFRKHPAVCFWPGVETGVLFDMAIGGVDWERESEGTRCNQSKQSNGRIEAKVSSC